MSSDNPVAPAVAQVSRSEVSPSEAASDNSATESQASDLAGIEYPGKHDVKLGRGGDANSHVGNIKFRQLISQYKPRYTAASRSNKPFVAEEVVQIWRGLEPPGRFLIRTNPALGDDSTWNDVGNRRARKKASQALREKDRSEDFVACLNRHHGHVGFPGMAAPFATAPRMGAPMSAGIAAPMAVGSAPANTNNNMAPGRSAAANEQSRKRARQPETMANRQVAPRPATGATGPLIAAHALQQLLQSSGAPNVIQPPQAPAPQVLAPAMPPQAPQVAVPSPAPYVAVPTPSPPVAAPAPPAPAPVQNLASSLNTLLPALELLLQQKQQQNQLQLQTQQTMATVANALQSLVSTQPNQSTPGGTNLANQLVAALSSHMLSQFGAGTTGSSPPNTTAPTPSHLGTTTPAPTQPATNASGPLGNQAQNQIAAPGSNQMDPTPSQMTQDLDRFLATHIINNLLKPNTTQQQNGL